MKYMLLVYSNEAALRAASESSRNEMMAAYGAYVEALNKAGIAGGMDRLQPSSAATIVRNEGGKTKVLNGPYAEAKEQLGGYFIIDVPDLDAAITWASRCPGAVYGAVEVRPIWAM
jgi:hypothetical protein